MDEFLLSDRAGYVICLVTIVVAVYDLKLIGGEFGAFGAGACLMGCVCTLASILGQKAAKR